MAQRSLVGLYVDPEQGATAMDNLKAAGFGPHEYDVLTGTPYPEGTFGEHDPPHRLFRYPLIGAACGFAVALLLTVGTQLAYPVVTGGKPILSIPPMAIIIYEATMLGAILFTVLGILVESRLPRLIMGAYDRRITEGYIGVTVSCSEETLETAKQALQKAGPVEIKSDEDEP